MISSFRGWGIPAAVCLLAFSGRVSAQQVPAMLESQRSLQIPPQDILEACAGPKTPGSVNTLVPVAAPASRPVAVSAETRPAAVAVREQAPATGPAGVRPDPQDRESRVLARTGLHESVASAGIRESELKDVSRGRQNGSLWSVNDLWPLLSVMALVLVLAWIVKKATAGRRGLASSGVIEVLSRTSLSGKQSLILVRMGRRLLLLGVTGDEMHTLCAVEEPDQVAMLVGEAASAAPGSMTQAFAREFAEESRVYGPDVSDAEEETVDAGEPVRNLLDRIRCLTAKRNVA